MNNKLKFSILMPAYNMEPTIEETIRSILSQEYTNFEIIVHDNNSSDRTAEIVKSIKDDRILYFKNDQNLGGPRNLIAASKKAGGDILLIMGADDIMASGVLQDDYEVFSSDENIGAIIRPYFWFNKDIHSPVRVTKVMNPEKNEIISIHDPYDRIVSAFDNEIIGQISGLAFRKKYIEIDFDLNDWTLHGRVVMGILKKHPIAFMKNYQIAVRIGFNETRRKSPLFDMSPVKSWINEINEVFIEKEYKKLRKYLIQNLVVKNYIGLIQIKNFGKYSSLLKEIWYMIKYRPMNLLSLSFWFFALGTMIVPDFILLPLVDFYKEKVLKNKYSRQKIDFKYKL